MLLELREAVPGQRKKLMDIYRQSNIENIAYFFPDAGNEETGLAMVENSFMEFMEEFITREENRCYIWEEEGEWLSALRVERFDGYWFLEALETRPDRRKRGYAERLMIAVIQRLRGYGRVIIRDSVSKNNEASIALHRKCGFFIETENGVDYPGGEPDAGCYGMAYFEE